MARSNQLYITILSITSDYMGPAAPRFIDRQIQNHLKKDPEDISFKDLEKLIEWLRIAVALLTENKKIREQYIRRLYDLLSEENNLQLN